MAPEFIAGEINDDENGYFRAFGNISEALKRLKGMGVESIELRMVRPKTSPDLVLKALENLKRHGLGFTIHGLLPAKDDSVETVEQFPLWSVADWIREEQGEAVVTVHSRFHAEPGENVQTYAELTQNSLRGLLREIEAQKAPYKIALEINREKAKTDPSFTWEGVVSMVKAVNHPALGICWDMGHSFSNASRGVIPVMPPDEFASRVIHTHIHDLSPEGRTHWPLREKKVPIQEFCQILHKLGYSGVYNLEIGPDRFLEDPDIARSLYDSAETMLEIVRNL